MADVKCPTCGNDMIAIGCRVTDRPMHYCVFDGTLRTCEGEDFIVPVTIDTRVGAAPTASVDPIPSEHFNPGETTRD